MGVFLVDSGTTLMAALLSGLIPVLEAAQAFEARLLKDLAYFVSRPQNSIVLGFYCA